MALSNMLKEIILFILFIASAIIGVFAGYIHAKRGSEFNPVWPVKLFLSFIKSTIFKKYADNRYNFQFRERFMAAVFAWFFMIFIASIIVFSAILFIAA